MKQIKQFFLEGEIPTLKYENKFATVSLKVHPQDITTFIIVRCRQMKILKKPAPFGVSKSQETQNIEPTTQTFSQVWLFDKMISSEIYGS